LNCHRAIDSLQGAGKLDQKGVPDRPDLPASELFQQRPDQTPVFIEKPYGQGLIPLGEAGETDHVGEHDRGKSSLVFEHPGILHFVFDSNQMSEPNHTRLLIYLT
jgi:hypothetical protein